MARKCSLVGRLEVSKPEKAAQRSLCMGQPASWHAFEQYRTLLHRLQRLVPDLSHTVHKPRAPVLVMICKVKG